MSYLSYMCMANLCAINVHSCPFFFHSHSTQLHQPHLECLKAHISSFYFLFKPCGCGLCTFLIEHFSTWPAVSFLLSVHIVFLTSKNGSQGRRHEWKRIICLLKINAMRIYSKEDKKKAPKSHDDCSSTRSLPLDNERELSDTFTD